MSRLQTNEYECNYEDAATYDSRSEENDLQSVRFTEKDKENIAASSPYIRQLLENTKLEILQHDEVRNAYKSKEIGLFHLFLRQSMFNTICKWTNEELVKKGKNRITIEKFKAYVGLEIAMSIVKLNDISDYWSTAMFLGHKDFSNVMSRDDFESIRSSLKFYPTYDHDVASQDPL